MSRLNRAMLLAGVSACALAVGVDVARAGSAPLGYWSPGQAATTAVMAATQAGAQQAAAAARQTQITVQRVTQSIAAMQAAQAAARAAANAAASVVPNGLTAGGLMPDSGVPSNGNLPPSWQNVSALSQSTSGGQTTVDIKQSDTQALLNWQTFNVGKNTTVNFDQQGHSDWIALNRVLDPSSNPSLILGNIKADGQVYLINQNGIIFGGSSQVNVGSLIASALPINDSLLRAGILFLNPDGQFTFSAYSQPGGSAGPTDPFTPSPATAQSQDSAVIVQAGAQISTPLSSSHSGGRVILIGPQVTNAGSISTPDGQTILAAGQQVALMPHDTGNGTTDAGDPSLRGLDVFIGSVLAPQIGSSTVASAVATGNATNSGIVEADRGNITMSGAALVQSGALISTTSVSLNGRVDLNAAFNAQWQTNERFAVPAAGTVRMEAGSVTEILPEYASADTVIGTSLALPSQINIAGNALYIDGAIVAPNGKVAIGGGPASGIGSISLPLSSQVYLDADAAIDVSGSMGVQASVAENIVAAELEGAQLAGSPLQRASFLHGATIFVDVNQTGTNPDGSTWIGTPLADVSGYVNLIQRNVGELTVAGGSISLNAGGSVVLQNGSLLNVSGGYIDYQGANVQTTRLFAGGHIYDINEAAPNIIYDGVAGQFTVDHAHWGITDIYSSPLLTGLRYQADYIQGGAGGSISIQAPTAAIDGELLGLTVAGERQRTVQPPPSTLSIAFQPGPSSAAIPPPATPDVIFKSGIVETAPSFDPASLSLDPNATIFLSPDLADRFGILNVNTSNGSVSVLSPLIGKAGGSNSVSLTAANINVESDITVPGGKINLTVVDIDPGAIPEPITGFLDPGLLAGRGKLTLGAGTALSVAGLIVDDRATASTEQTLPIVVNGGSVSLSGFFLNLEAGSRIDASGGVAISGAGKLTNGNGGGISISGGSDALIDPSVVGQFRLGATLSGYGVGVSGKGGSLSIAAPAIQVGGTTASATTLLLDPSFFDQGGFSSFTLNGAGRNSLVPGQRIPGFLVAAGTTIDPAVQSTAISEAPDGTIDLTPTLLPAINRAPVSLKFSASGVTSPAPGVGLVVPGDAVLSMGASIVADATSRGAGAVSFGGSTVAVLGSIIARGGAISIGGASAIGSANDPSITVDLAPGSIVSAAGVWLPTQDSLGHIIGTVLPGGSVAISGNILGEQGALIDVSGASGSVQMTSSIGFAGLPLQTITIDSTGGSVALNGGNELFTQATLRANAGGPTASGGSLQVSSGPTLVGAVSANLVVTEHTPAGFSHLSGLAAIGSTVLNNGAANTIGRFAVDDFANGGFDSLTLGGYVKFSGPDPVSIVAGKSISVAGTGNPGCSGCVAWLSTDISVSLTAPYVAIGLLSAAAQGNPAIIAAPPVPAGIVPTGGSGSLTVTASSLIDVGSLVLAGTGTTTLNSAGDVRGNGTFEAAGSITIRASQIYPTTEGIFTIMAFDSSNGPGSVTFARTTDVLPQLPLSGGGVLNVFASSIVQDGVIRAPIGQINLGVTADQIAANPTQIFPTTRSVTLADGSVTSVSAVDPVTEQALILPYGTMLNGTNWIDPSGTDITIGGLPAKTVNLSGVSVAVAAGATLDLTGGGDLYAYNWVKGLGGNNDILATSNGFAIIPGFASPFAPVAQIIKQNNDGTTGAEAGWSSNNLAVGDQIVLTASTNGLPAGIYTLLPARYALLPGAFLVTPVKGAQNSLRSISVAQPDGSSVVSGTRFNSLDRSIQRSPIATLFEVDTAAVVRSRAEYDDFFANAALPASAAANDAAVPRLPIDAGQLVLTATGSLVVNGTALMSAAPGGIGGLVSIASPNNIVINDTGLAPSGQSSAGTLFLSAAGLTAFGAESLLIGGFVNTAGTVTVTTSNVTLANDSTTPLAGPDITLVSNANLTIAPGGVLRTQGALSGSADTLLFGSANTSGTGDGTLIRVSSDPSAKVSRDPTSVSIGGGVASLAIGPHATIQSAGGTVILDSTNAVSLDTSATVNGASLALGAGRISLQLDDAGALQPNAGLVLPGQALAGLQSSGGALSLLSYSAIDIYGTGTVGSVDLGSLAFHAASLRGFNQDNGTVTFLAQNVLLDNSSGQAASAVTSVNTTPSGSFGIDSNTITIGANTLKIVGYSEVNLNASQGLLLQDSGGLATAGNLTVTTPGITASTGASQSLSADGALTIGTMAGVPTVGSRLGANVTLTGASITDVGAISLPSGTLKLHATSGDVTIGSGGKLDVSGVGVAFFDQVRYSGGGEVVLTADAGSVLLQSGSAVDVSAPAAAGNAGLLSASAAQGTFAFDGTLRGSGGADGQGGSFMLDVDHLQADGSGTQSLGALNRVLNDSGFTLARSIRLRTGNVLVDGIATSKTFNLAADSGSITVTGSIDASGVTGGAIALYAYNGVTLVNGSLLTVEARQFDDAGKGGSVDLETGEAKSIGGVMTPGVGWIDILTGSTINLAVNGAPGGTLHLRAPQIDSSGDPIPVNSTTAGNDVAIKPLNGTIINPSSIVAEGYAIFDLTSSGGVIDATAEANIDANGKGFASAANTAAITGHLLGGTPNAGFASVLHIQPGEEIVNLTTLPFTLNTKGSSLSIPAGTGILFATGTPAGDTVSFSSSGIITAANGTVTPFAAGTPVTVSAGSTVALDHFGIMSFASGSTPVNVSLKGAGTLSAGTGSSTTVTVPGGSGVTLGGAGSGLNLPANTTVTFTNGIPVGDAIAVANGTTFTAPAAGNLITLTTPGSGVVFSGATGLVLPPGDVVSSTGAFSTILNGSTVTLGTGKTITLPNGVTVGLAFTGGATVNNNINGATITTTVPGGAITLNASISSSVTVRDNVTQLRFPNGTPGTDKISTSTAATIVNPDGTTTPLAARAPVALAPGSSLILSGSPTGGTVTFASGSTSIPIALGSGAYTLSNLTSITSLPANSTIATGTGSGTLSVTGSAVSMSLSPGRYTTTGQITNLAAGTTIFGGTLTWVSGSLPLLLQLPASTFTATGGGVQVDSLAAGTTVKASTAGALTVSAGDAPVLLSLPAGSFTANGATSFALASDLTLATDWNLNGFRYGPNAFPAMLGSGEPGILTLRSTGNLVFNGALSDGFGASPTDPSTHQPALWEAPLLAPGSQSWSYRLTAGADFAGVDFHDVLASSGASGSVMIGKTGASDTSSSTATTASLLNTLYQVVRTGTGDIDVSAASDVQLLNQFATIYTAGSQVIPQLTNGDVQYAFDTPNTNYVLPNGSNLLGSIPGPLYPAQFSTGGGNVTIAAGRDIIHLKANGADDSTQELPNNWLYRRDNVVNGSFAPTLNGDHGSTTWWIDFSNFFEGVGALGGGNVTLRAGRDIKNVDAVVPTNAWAPYQTATTTPAGTVVDVTAAAQPLFELGGGDLLISAGRDINGGVYHVEKGAGDLLAGRDVTTNATRVAGLPDRPVTTTDPVNWLPTTLFLGNGVFDITAGGDVLLGSVANPFLLPMGMNNSYVDRTYFSTYDPSNSVDIFSLTGAVTLKGNTEGNGSLSAWIASVLAFGVAPPSGPGQTVSFTRPWLRLTEGAGLTGTVGRAYASAASMMPPNLSVAALSGNINVVGNLNLAPAPSGTLDLEAAGTISGLQPVESFLAGLINFPIYTNAAINLSNADPV